MPAPSLKSLATAACIANIKRIDDLGDQPSYLVLRPVLLKVENPTQLRTLEQNSPWLANDSAELWRAFIKRDIPHWQSKLVEPKNPASWWKVYRKLKREADAEVAAQSEVLRAALRGREDDRKKNTIQVMSVAEAPRVKGQQRQQNQYTNLAKGGNSTTLAFNSGSKTKLNTGKSVMERARREAKEHSLFHGRNKLATPTHLLAMGQRPNQVTKVPKSMAAASGGEGKAKEAPPWMQEDPKRSTNIMSPDTSKAHHDIPRVSTESSSIPTINFEGAEHTSARSRLGIDRPRTTSPNRRPGVSPGPSPRPPKRAAPSIFMTPTKKRKPG